MYKRQVNIRVVIVTVKALGTHTLHEHLHRQSGMGIGSEINTALIIQDVGNGYGKRLIASVADILILGEFR